MTDLYVDQADDETVNVGPVIADDGTYLAVTTHTTTLVVKASKSASDASGKTYVGTFSGSDTAGWVARFTIPKADLAVIGVYFYRCRVVDPAGLVQTAAAGRWLVDTGRGSGGQAISTPSQVALGFASHTGAVDPHVGYRLESVPITAADVAADIATQAELDAQSATYVPLAGAATIAGLKDFTTAPTVNGAPFGGTSDGERFDVTKAPYNAKPAATNFATVAAGSNLQRLPQATLNLSSTALLPPSGAVAVTTNQGVVAVAYTGKTATTLTGCTGGVGEIYTGNKVYVDNTAAIQAAITAAMNGGANGSGGTVFFPYQTSFYCCGQLNFDGAYGLTLQGSQDVASSGIVPSRGLICASAGSGSFISARGSGGCNVRNLRVLYTNPLFTGRVIDARGVIAASDTGNFLVEHCEVRGEGSRQITDGEVTTTGFSPTFRSMQTTFTVEDVGNILQGGTAIIPQYSQIATIVGPNEVVLACQLNGPGVVATGTGIVQSIAVAGALYDIDFDQNIEPQVRRTFLGLAQYGLGMSTTGTYCNAGTFSDVTFLNNIKQHTRGGGQGLLFITPTFEGLINGNAGAYDDTQGGSLGPVIFLNPWCGDVFVAGKPWFRVTGAGVRIIGGTLNAPGGDTTAAVVLGNSTGGLVGFSMTNTYIGYALGVTTTGTGFISDVALTFNSTAGVLYTDPTGRFSGQETVIGGVGTGGVNRLSAPVQFADSFQAGQITTAPSNSGPTKFGTFSGGIGAKAGAFGGVAPNGFDFWVGATRALTIETATVGGILARLPITQSLTHVTTAAAIQLNPYTDQITEVTLTGNIGTFSVFGGTEGEIIVVDVVQDAVGGRTYAFPAAFKFPNGVPPIPSTSPNARDSYTFRCITGFNFTALSWTMGDGEARLAETVQTASHTAVLADMGRVVAMNVGAANTFTIPPGVFPVGAILDMYEAGAGITTLTPGAGVTLVNFGSKFKMAGQGASAKLRQRALNTWVVSGETTV